MAGYSQTPPTQKLGIKNGHVVVRKELRGQEPQ